MATESTIPGQAPSSLGLALAFVNTRYGSGPRYHEELDTTEGLRAWLTQHHLLDDHAPVTEGDLRRAISVREALRSVLRANTPTIAVEQGSASSQKRVGHASLRRAVRTLSTGVISAHNATEAAADVLNAIAAYALLSVRFHEGGQATLEPAIDGVDGALARLLAAVPLAQADGSWRRLKVCRFDACGRAFFDTSKNHSGVWCDLGKCGNLLNARASRARHRPDHRGLRVDPAHHQCDDSFPAITMAQVTT